MEPFVRPDPRCFECEYWRSLSGYSNKSGKACHYCLENGQMRKRKSDTECESYEPRGTQDHRKGFEAVPMTQWGCYGNVVDWLSQR